MSFQKNIEVRRGQFNNEAIYDAFGRQRVSEPTTLWDSKLLGDNRPLFWDDAEVSGDDTTSTYSADTSSVVLAVAEETAGLRVRQTKQRFNYQPGKSQLVFITGTLGAGTPGITRRIGYFDDNNGVFFELNNTTLSVNIRSSTTTEVVDTKVASANWNLGARLQAQTKFDTATSQIFVFDLEWLGVGSVRCGVVIDGAVEYVHQFNHANVQAGVYMTTPNLPIRYEIENDGEGLAAEMECICSTVMSEGGQQETGATLGLTTIPTALAANTIGTYYAAIGIRLKDTHLDNVVKVVETELINIAAGQANFAWELRLNPTVAGEGDDALTYADVDNAPIQAAYGKVANTVTGGTITAAGLARSGTSAARIIENLLYIGSKIDGTRDTLVLVVTPLASNASIHATMTIQFA